jgi:murein DD-endopeptidase MepM/ murein hydrolase activator NlpD
MDIIVVSGKLAQARTYRVTRLHLALAGLSVLLVAAGLTVVLHHLALRYAVENRSPYLRELMADVHAQESRQAQAYLRESLDALASRIGVIHAEMVRLNSLGERISALAGLERSEAGVFNLGPARGGAFVDAASGDLSVARLDQHIALLADRLDDGRERLRLIEAALIEANAKRQLTPSASPAPGAGLTSRFGWRPDPFNGQTAFHEGLDFAAAAGSPIVAAAGGIVVASELRPQYGNMIEIDHGNGLVTRYGHASRRWVKVGDVVARGARIGDVGSTGRSTGPHLHFEVRLGGVAQDPAKFLRPPG